MNRPKEVKLQLKNSAIKNSTPYERGSKQSSTLQHEKGSKMRKKNQTKEWTTKETGIQRYLNQIIQPLLVFIQQCEERKTGRKEDREATIRREKGWRELNVKPQNKVGKGKELKRGERKLKPCRKTKSSNCENRGFLKVSVEKALDLGFMV